MRDIGTIGPGHPWAGAEVSYDDPTGQWYVNGLPAGAKAVAGIRTFLVAEGVPLPHQETPAAAYAEADDRHHRLKKRVTVLVAVVLPLLACSLTGVMGARWLWTGLQDYALHNYAAYEKTDPVYGEAEAYALASNGHFRGLLLPRRVSPATPEETKAEMGLRGGSVAAWYDRDRRTIRVVTAPAEEMRETFTYVLRHEYGHALMADYLEANGGGSGGVLLYDELTVLRPGIMKDSDIGRMPRELQPVARAWKDDPDALGSYGATAFAEHMAECYARYVTELDLPPGAKAWFSALESRGTLQAP